MKDVVISLFDVTGNMVRPWLGDGYTCIVVDIQHPVAYETGGITLVGDRFYKVHADLTHPWLTRVDRERIAFVAAFPPCDHMAVSGARWFRGKGLRRLAQSIDMFATAAEFCEWAGAPYMIENPVSTISTYWRKPDHAFSPEDYTGYCLDDNYTKRTCIWSGNGFVMPEPFRLNGLPPPDDRIHKCPPGPERHNIRSATPMGFARAVKLANAPGALNA
jgi:hypothetical protein